MPIQHYSITYSIYDLLLKMMQKQRYILPEHDRLNLGCGSNIAQGWINIDNSPGALLAKYPLLRLALYRLGLLSHEHYMAPWPKEIMVHDITRGLPFMSESVSYIYTSHFLEHLTHAQVIRVLSGCFRVLRPGGLIRIVVPDLFQLAKRYVEKMQTALEKDILNDAPFISFMKFITGHMKSVDGYNQEGIERSSHNYMYDYPSLHHLLKETGFINIVQYEFKKGKVPDIELLDTRPDEGLYVEATKPS